MAMMEGCAARPSEFQGAVEDFVYSSLALSPVSATQAGYHVHQGVRLDERLDDFSPAGIEAQRRFFEGFRSRLESFPESALDAEERADRRIMEDQIALALLDLDTTQSWRHNPTVYVELIGNAMFAPYTLDYAPKVRRYRHIIARLKAVPALIEQAKANLVDAPAVWNRVAQEELDGDIGLIDRTLRADAPAELGIEYERASGVALEALRDFRSYLGLTLAGKTSDWRLGPEVYAKKFALVIANGETPAQTLADAEAEMERIRGEMAQMAAPKTIQEALDEIARQHPKREDYFNEAKRDLERATQFVAARGLVPLPSGETLRVIPTPEFMRGIYGVGGFNPAPPLEPSLGGFYWITPIPADWPAERVESKLREYNRYGLEHLTIHEAMPGHWVQFEYANRIEPRSRRLLRAVFGSGPYVEGWAVYAQQLLTDEGYLDGDPGLKMTFYKQMLRVVANTILDIRLQTMGMTEEQALDLMINQTYQEREEAVAKLQRAQLSSCQLPTYFAGWRGWLRVRAEDEKRMGPRFHLYDFHRRALNEGAVPLAVLNGLLASQE
jgi:uncharacterized protein (DUF885 family)